MIQGMGGHCIHLLHKCSFIQHILLELLLGARFWARATELKDTQPYPQGAHHPVGQTAER